MLLRSWLASKKSFSNRPVDERHSLATTKPTILLIFFFLSLTVKQQWRGSIITDFFICAISYEEHDHQILKAYLRWWVSATGASGNKKVISLPVSFL